MKAFVSVLMVALGVLPISGCLRKEVRQTLYLSPSGVAWTVVESQVRSDEGTPVERIAEEHDYFLAASAGAHPIARAFQHLGAQSVQTTWLRRERPYSVATAARFADMRELALAILRDARVAGDVALVRTGCRTKFTVRADLSSARATPDDAALDELNELITDLDTSRLVLTEGRFVAADGFQITDEGTRATPDPAKTATDGLLTLLLEWVDESCHEP
jgi:hypothetical protein